jgi:hypothetical protein
MERLGILPLLMLTCSPAAHASADVDALLARVARPAPATVHYAEARFSRLLSEPVVTGGRLEYGAPGKLAKFVERPYREDLTVSGDEVRVQRPGEPVRRFSLARAPELRGLLASFGALLAGDRALLEKHFDLALGEGANGWTLRLTPRDARTRTQIRAIEVRGRADQARCLAVLEPDGDASVMLFGELAHEPLPAQFGRELLDHRCAVASAG